MSLPLLGVGSTAPGIAGLTLPAYLSSTAPQQLENFEVFADWTRVGVNGTISDDTTRFSQGTHGFKMLSSGASNNVTATKTGAVSDFSGSTYDIQALDVYVHDAGSVGKIARLGMFTTTGLTRGMATPTSGANSLTTYRLGWNRFVVRRAQYASIGSGAWTDALPVLTVGLIGTGLGQSITVDNWQYNLTPVGAVCWTLHDSFDNLYTLGYPEFSSRGLRGSLVFDTGRIGTANHMTWPQTTEMIGAGWTAVNHFQTHTNPAAFTQAQVEAEIDLASADWVAHSVPTPTEFVSPGGGWSDAVRAGALNRGMIFGNGIDEGYAYLPNPDKINSETREFENHTAAQIQVYLDEILARGGLVVGYLHNVDAAVSASDRIKLSDLQTALAYCVTNHIPCITMHQAALLNAGQAVTVQVPWI